MRITDLDIPASICDEYGLKPVKMSRLGKVVVIAGPNGAGKTRSLNLIKAAYGRYPGDVFASYHGQITALKIQNAELEKTISQNPDNATQSQQANKIINDNKASISHFESLIKEFTYCVLEPDYINDGVIAFFPKVTHLADTYSMNPHQIEERETLVDRIGTDQISQGVIAKIQTITHHYIAAITRREKIAEADAVKYIADFENLSATIEQFLNVRLDYDDKLHPTLFGKRIGSANLSQGQVILLQLCLAIYAQGSRLDKLILLIDEPENHLYPKALVEALDKIVANIGEGQVFITTHSVHVLAHFDPSSIWYIDNGEIRYAGNIPHTVLGGLLGGDEEKIKLTNFLSLPEVMAFNKFSYECLMDPKVLMTGINDPQVNQTHDLLQKLCANGSRIKVMDFGMGQGRLLATISELEKQVGRDVTQWLDYHGYDISAEYKDNCEALFSSIYSDRKQRYFNDSAKLMAELDKGDFDVVIMCNVLHEIDPKEWIHLFTSSNSVFTLLKPTGHLVIIEDQLLPVGEMAHPNGFLVFDSPQFKSLFKVKKSEGYYCRAHNQNNRLQAHFIPASFISKLDDESRKDAILSVRDDALTQVRKIRLSKEKSFQSGRLHAFWVQQLANATLCIQELGYNVPHEKSVSE